MGRDLFSLSAYEYDLPPGLIAQQPWTPRDESRLMLVERKSERISELKFYEIRDFLEKEDHLVFNDTQVIPARLKGKKESGAAVEIFLIKEYRPKCWEVLGRPGKKLRPGDRVYFGDDFYCQIIETLPDGSKMVEFVFEGAFEATLEKYGQLPLPHYIERDNITSEDRIRYQTVYAKHRGAVAAPTAGLHFTDELLASLDHKGVLQTHVTLHVGLGTFKPVHTEDIREFQIHSESFMITPEAANRLNHRNPTKRTICVGTTSCRTLESASDARGIVQPGSYDTSIFIYPGYQFKFMTGLLTNFHVPRSTLLMLVCAFGGYELIMEAYAKAMKEGFRFYSYGDAMLII